jgi:nucleoside-diphosphate-sugar epimerase
MLVTGGAGFIGSRLAGRLLAAGHEVHAVDDLSLSTRDNLAPLAADARLTVTVMDVCAPPFAELLARWASDRAYHFAANSDISRGTSEPRTDLEHTFCA